MALTSRSGWGNGRGRLVVLPIVLLRRQVEALLPVGLLGMMVRRFILTGMIVIAIPVYV